MAGHPTYQVNVIKLLAQGWLRWASEPSVVVFFFLVVFMVSWSSFIF